MAALLRHLLTRRASAARRGYVLDGWPRTAGAARLVWGKAVPAEVPPAAAGGGGGAGEEGKAGAKVRRGWGRCTSPVLDCEQRLQWLHAGHIRTPLLHTHQATHPYPLPPTLSSCSVCPGCWQVCGELSRPRCTSSSCQGRSSQARGQARWRWRCWGGGPRGRGPGGAGGACGAGGGPHHLAPPGGAGEACSATQGREGGRRPWGLHPASSPVAQCVPTRAWLAAEQTTEAAATHGVDVRAGITRRLPCCCSWTAPRRSWCGGWLPWQQQRPRHWLRPGHPRLLPRHPALQVPRRAGPLGRRRQACPPAATMTRPAWLGAWGPGAPCWRQKQRSWQPRWGSWLTLVLDWHNARAEDG